MILVLCPTRGRPEAARETYTSFVAMQADPRTELLFIVDDDDPVLSAYETEGLPLHVVSAPGNMVNALNQAAAWATSPGSPFSIIGFVGDDHRFRTPGWDRIIDPYLTEAGGGFAYANDLAQAMNLPTQVFVSADIIRTLGWFGLPGCHHLYIDNAWKVLGEESGSLAYFPDIVIEHLHPAYGKGDWDEGHRRVNSEAMFSHDGTVFAEWLKNGAQADVAKVRESLHR
jgi:hypothetical protein